MDKSLAKEILKRYIEEQKIKCLITDNFDFAKELKTRRGLIHDLVAEALDVSVTVVLIKKINTQLKLLGVRPVRNRGMRFYRGLGVK